MRVRGSGVVAFTTDKEVRRAAFALSSRLFLVDVDDIASCEIATARRWSTRASIPRGVALPTRVTTGSMWWTNRATGC